MGVLNLTSYVYKGNDVLEDHILIAEGVFSIFIERMFKKELIKVLNEKCNVEITGHEKPNQFAHTVSTLSSRTLYKALEHLNIGSIRVLHYGGKLPIKNFKKIFDKFIIKSGVNVIDIGVNIKLPNNINDKLLLMKKVGITRYEDGYVKNIPLLSFLGNGYGGFTFYSNYYDHRNSLEDIPDNLFSNFGFDIKGILDLICI